MGLYGEAGAMLREMRRHEARGYTTSEDVTAAVIAGVIAGGLLAGVISLILYCFVLDPAYTKSGEDVYPYLAGILTTCITLGIAFGLSMLLGDHLDKKWPLVTFPAITVLLCILIFFASGYVDSQTAVYNKYKGGEKIGALESISSMGDDIIIEERIEKEEKAKAAEEAGAPYAEDYDSYMEKEYTKAYNEQMLKDAQDAYDEYRQ
ncbi:MAG: hypothetical protein VB031_05740 [Eubacteriaceae bacterium]|nr:hypothetical protein [Eubacteriaceae bacterium]